MFECINRGGACARGLFTPRLSNLHLRPVALFVFAATLLVSAPSKSLLAASINYGNFIGSSVTYINVTEASSTDPVPLYGAPSVAGDALDFNPILFGATSLNGVPPLDFTDGQLVFEAQAKAGSAMANIRFDEGGAFAVVGIGNNNTYIDVTAHGNLDIVQIDGLGVNTIKIPIDLVFSHRPDGTWRLGTDGPQTSTGWTGTQFINLNGELTSRGISFTRGVTRVKVDLDNALIAQSVQGTIAFIDKKDVGFRVHVNIPEPTTICLSLVAMLAGTFFARRSRS